MKSRDALNDVSYRPTSTAVRTVRISAIFQYVDHVGWFCPSTCV